MAETYQEVFAVYANSEPNKCRQLSSTFDDDYMWCMRSELPVTKTLTITLEPDLKKNKRGKRNRHQLKNEHKFFNEQPPENARAYRQLCAGDSGSGYFMSSQTNLETNDINDLKYTLTSITTTNVKEEFTDKNGNIHEVPCGAHTYHRKTGKYLEFAQYSQSLANPVISNWVKRKASICKASYCTIL